MRIVQQSVKLLSITPNAEKLIERSARTCYQSFDKMDKSSYQKLIRYLISVGHESVLEHAVATFRIITNRGISHEIVRHRLASYSQESTRYCAYKNDIEVIVPHGLDEDSFLLWKELMLKIEETYHKLLSNGISPQNARDVLPTCLKTELIMTANFREWRHIIKLRTSKQAHPQIRELCSMILDELYSRCPIIFEDLKS